MTRLSLKLFFSNAITILAVAALPPSSLAQQPSLRDVLSIYHDLNDMCRGRSDGEDPRAARACNIREKVARLLNSMGYCYGTINQDAADMRWHRCTSHDLF